MSSPQITPGFSGAPVFDTVSRRVVGMVTAIASQDEHGRMAETAFITPTETLRMICPQLALSEVQPYMGLAVFSALALILAGAVVWEWNLSEQKTGEAVGFDLASQSIKIEPVYESDWMRKTLLAVESLRQGETVQGDLALRESIASLGVPLAEFNHNESVNSVAFSPDGKKVATASSDNTARIWPVSTDDLIKEEMIIKKGSI